MDVAVACVGPVYARASSVSNSRHGNPSQACGCCWKIAPPPSENGFGSMRSWISCLLFIASLKHRRHSENWAH